MKIILIDDHALFRIGLKELLERRGIDVVAALASCQGAQDVIAEHMPDVVVLDMRMPDMTGLEFLKQLRENKFSMPITMLTTSRVDRDVIDSLQSGAQGYLLKDIEPDELIKSLNNIVAGNIIVAPELMGILANAVKGESASEEAKKDLVSSLTPREHEILCLVAEGQSNKVIARNLGISDGTVKLHVKAILRKLEVHSRVEAAVIAVEKNLCTELPRK